MIWVTRKKESNFTWRVFIFGPSLDQKTTKFPTLARTLALSVLTRQVANAPTHLPANEKVTNDNKWCLETGENV